MKIVLLLQEIHRVDEVGEPVDQYHLIEMQSVSGQTVVLWVPKADLSRIVGTLNHSLEDQGPPSNDLADLETRNSQPSLSAFEDGDGTFNPGLIAGEPQSSAPLELRHTGGRSGRMLEVLLLVMVCAAGIIASIYVPTVIRLGLSGICFALLVLFACIDRYRYRKRLSQWSTHDRDLRRRAVQIRAAYLRRASEERRQLQKASSEVRRLEDPRGRLLGISGRVTLYERWIETPQGGGSLIGVIATATDETGIRQRLTVTRMVTLGVFSLAAPKQHGTGNAYVVIEGPEVSGVAVFPGNKNAQAGPKAFALAARINAAARAAADFECSRVELLKVARDRLQELEDTSTLGRIRAEYEETTRSIPAELLWTVPAVDRRRQFSLTELGLLIAPSRRAASSEVVTGRNRSHRVGPTLLGALVLGVVVLGLSVGSSRFMHRNGPSVAAPIFMAFDPLAEQRPAAATSDAYVAEVCWTGDSWNVDVDALFGEHQSLSYMSIATDQCLVASVEGHHVFSVMIENEPYEGMVGCEIRIDGKVVKESVSELPITNCYYHS